MADIDTLNMLQASLAMGLKQIKNQIEDEDYAPILMLGKAGIGKTESVANLAKEMGIGFTELRLTIYQESDLIGLPKIEDGVTKHYPSTVLPPQDDKGQGILFFDEVTSAPRNMRTAVLQLMDSSRKLGEYVLPPKWMIVCAGNGPDDGGDFEGLEPAFLNRGVAFRVEPNLDDWKAWAVQSGVHPTVVAYLSWRPEDLHVMDIDKPSDLIASPRSWNKLSKQLKMYEKNSKGGIIENDDEVVFCSSICVGAKVGPQFAAFYRYNRHTINTSDILEGKADPKAIVNVDDQIVYITAQNVIHLLVKSVKENKADTESTVNDKCLNQICNTLRWVVNAYAAGMKMDVAVEIISGLAKGVKGIETIIMSEALAEKCPEFDDFIMANRKAINLF